MTFIHNLIFATLRQTIFAPHARRHETVDLCFITREDILFFEFQLFWKEQIKVDMFTLLQSIFPHCRN